VVGAPAGADDPRGAGVTPLAGKLAARIRATGPITVADYMAACLADPEHGYYMRGDPFGRAGDFITAPEVSQMFGELIGLFVVAAWERMGEPSNVMLTELGPGRGTLMADMLRAAAVKPAFLSAADIHLVEIGPRLKEVQRATLAPTRVAVHWHARLADVPDGPTILIANEFFDALPIRQFQWSDGRWSERMIGLADNGALTVGLRPIDQREADVSLPDGAVLEAGTLRDWVAAEIGARLARFGGAALVIDYGSERAGYGDTLQAVKAHRYDHPLANPGEADLTAHVDFAALARAAGRAGAASRPVMRQGEFLLRLGLIQRAEVLARGKDQKTRDAIAAAMDRLAGKKAMGDLFKVLALASPGLKLPAFDV
jgi:NADH dehydrogenase [ubiquinone] 1 alpha subcomplex assembly factor 7